MAAKNEHTGADIKTGVPNENYLNKYDDIDFSIKWNPDEDKPKEQGGSDGDK